MPQPQAPQPRLYIVTDRHLSDDAGDDIVATMRAVLAVLPNGAALVQLREKDLDGHDLAELARALLPVTQAHSAPLLINDRIDVALAVGAAGVHLPSTSFRVAQARALLGPDRLIGISCHGAADVAAARGADIAVLGPIWPTRGKESAIGTGALAQTTDMRVFAIGGIDSAERASVAVASGAHGIAGIRAFSRPATAKAMFDILPS